MRRRFRRFACVLSWSIVLPVLLQAAEPQPVSQQAAPRDSRLERLKTLDDYFPFTPCDTPAAWARRAEQVRRQLLVANGLWPMPTATPANAVVHGRVDRDGYTVERVFLQSFPGHYVSGSLYRPKGRSGRLPGVLCPHGHWAEGRFHDAGEKQVKADIEHGAEKHAVGGRHPLQARCVQLARMGCIVFHYDMEGYADSQQLPHRPGVREAMNAEHDWGYFSPQAELRLQNTMGLQTYNSIRVLDWLTALPDVDPKRIGVTGASGGGTQTFILGAIDPRPAVLFPAVMVSTAMQGGCTCENAPYLRVGTGNVEIAALAGPRPLGLTAANDWTKEMETKGFPELKRHYGMLGAEDNVALTALLHFGHNYNYPSRAAMYAWMNRHLALGHDEPIVENDYRPLTKEEMTVWNDEHPRPPAGVDHERALLRWITADSDKQMLALMPRDAAGLNEFRRVIGGAVDVMIGRGLPKAGEVDGQRGNVEKRGQWTVEHHRVNFTPAKEQLPVIVVRPEQSNGRVVVWISREGKGSLFDGAAVRPEFASLLSSGAAVVGVDLFGQGEFAQALPMARNRMDTRGKEPWQAYAGYTYGYNHPLFSQRVHDILTVVAWLREKEQAKEVAVVGLDGAGHWVAAARAQAQAAIDCAAIDTGGFRFARLKACDDADFLPGAAKYLDLPGMLALSSPLPLWLSDDGPSVDVVRESYRAAGSADSAGLEIDEETDAAKRRAAALAWLAEKWRPQP